MGHKESDMTEHACNERWYLCGITWLWSNCLNFLKNMGYAIIPWEEAAYFQFKYIFHPIGAHPQAFNVKSIYLDPPQYTQLMLQD